MVESGRMLHILMFRLCLLPNMVMNELLLMLMLLLGPITVRQTSGLLKRIPAVLSVHRERRSNFRETQEPKLRTEPMDLKWRTRFV